MIKAGAGDGVKTLGSSAGWDGRDGPGGPWPVGTEQVTADPDRPLRKRLEIREEIVEQIEKSVRFVGTTASRAAFNE
ncbi:hypothetical protein GCM10010313_20780 [Streptomyces violarus]|nr:hypothetical protein GCM10010313_20780 [Streptomyces violarus]